MSKASAKASVAAAKDGDICPVCKSSRYLNPNMRFLVNPECYHKMCESCVDRIFSHGPAPCPIAGCKRTLRKVKFRTQTFEDLKVEREVDIRRRVALALNKVQEDFESLRDYNDYLETVEEITFNLIYKVDVEATERRLKQWEESQKAERNDTTRSFQPDPSLPSDTAHVVLKKGAAQRKALATATGNNAPEPFGASDGTDTGTGFSFKGLKKYVPPEPEKPFDPYGGYSVQPQYYALRDDYDVDWLTKSKDDINAQAGGWDIHSFYSRALCDAFSGFGVFIEEEINQREMDVSMDASVGTQAAAAVAAGSREVNMDDVF